MLKIKDNVDLKELEKLGFELHNYNRNKWFLKEEKGVSYYVENKIIEIGTQSSNGLYDVDICKIQYELGCHKPYCAEDFECVIQDYENCPIYKLKDKLDKINDILDNILIMENRFTNKGYRPIKNTSRNDCYKAIIDIEKIIKEK